MVADNEYGLAILVVLNECVHHQASPLRLGRARDKVHPTPIAVEVGSLGRAQHAASARRHHAFVFRPWKTLVTLRAERMLPLFRETKTEF